MAQLSMVAHSSKHSATSSTKSASEDSNGTFCESLILSGFFPSTTVYTSPLAQRRGSVVVVTVVDVVVVKHRPHMTGHAARAIMVS